MSRVLVTGAAGYLGSALVQILLVRGYSVVALDVRFPNAGELPSFYQAPGIEAVQADICSREELDRRLGAVAGEVETVVHLAAIVGDDACRRDEARAYQVNTQGTRNVVEQAITLGASRFIFGSTCGNYGVTGGTLATEETPVQVTSFYGATKLEGERCVLAAATSNFHPVVLRFATVFGITPRVSFIPLLNALVFDAVVKGEVRLYEPYAWRPLVHAADAVQVIEACLQRLPGEIGGKVFNVGSDNYQKAQLAAIVKHHLPETQVATLGEKDSRSYLVSFARVARELGFRPTRAADDGVREMIAYLRGRVVS